MRFEWMGRQERQYVADVIGQVYIELSTACNLSCTTCVRHSIKDFKNAHFTRKLLNKLVGQLQGLSHLDRIVLLGFGEALCNPDIQWHLRQLSTLNVPIVLVTNGLLIMQHLAELFVLLPLEAVYISIDDPAGVKPVIRKGSDVHIPLQAITVLKETKISKKAQKPIIGVETVVTEYNGNSVVDIITMAKQAGAEQCIVSHVFPYNSAMSMAIAYSIDGKYDGLKQARKLLAHDSTVTVAESNASTLRRCPFIEKGTVFINVEGYISPCPELAYTHSAYYFGNSRTHIQHRFGNIAKNSIAAVWESAEFVSYRDKFRYFEFPDCTLCVEPDMCYHRTVENRDCYWNTSPCGECLWAKGIVLCP
ncbi:MAG: SPASM domain-containing protein [Spirochaetota bacterium]